MKEFYICASLNLSLARSDGQWHLMYLSEGHALRVCENRISPLRSFRLVNPASNDTAEQAAETFGTGQERRTSGAKPTGFSIAYGPTEVMP
jgi:hypothetical protein